MITTSFVFDHRGRAGKGKRGPIEVRVTVNRKSYYVSTGVKVLSSEWKYEQVVNRPDVVELNERLRYIMRIVAEEVNRCIAERREIDVVDIRRSVWGTSCGDDAGGEVTEWIESQIQTLGISDGTAAHYRTLVLRMRACAIINRWSDVTAEKIIEFDGWLRRLPAQTGRAKIEGKTVNGETVYNYHKCLRRMLTRAVMLGKIERNPYECLKGEFRKSPSSPVQYLTEEEVKAFMDYHPLAGTELEKAHDLFVVQMFTGLSWSDLMQFDIRHYKLENGVWVSIGTRMKTGVPYVGHLLPPVVDVLEKWDFQLPVLSNQCANRCLKVLGPAAGISTRLHTHMARHTFATLMLRAGAKIENVSKMLGHTNITQTQRYAQVLAQSVHEDYDLFAQQLNKKL